MPPVAEAAREGQLKLGSCVCHPEHKRSKARLLLPRDYSTPHKIKGGRKRRRRGEERRRDERRGQEREWRRSGEGVEDNAEVNHKTAHEIH